MIVRIFNTQNDLVICEKSVKALTLEVLNELKVSTDEIIINFVSCQKIQDLHEEFFNDSSETDCITFPIDGASRKSDNHHIIGEVFICPQVAKKTMPNLPYEETSLYLIHTLLHLVGYKDNQPNLRKIMELRQDELLKAIKSKKLLLTN